MANTIKIKAGSGTPTTSDIVDKELAFDRSADKLYINDNGTIVEVGGGTSGTITSVSNFSDNRVATASGSTTLNGEANLTFDGTDLKLLGDNLEMRWGASEDFKIYVDTVTAYLKNVTQDGDIRLQVNDGGSNITAIKIDGSEVGKVSLPNDGQTLSLGAGNDLTFQHDGSNSYIGNGVGHLYISNDTDDGDIILRTDDGSGGVATYIQIDGGATITKFDKATRHADSVTAYFGGGLDGRIYHNGSNFYIANTTTGDMYIQNELDDKDIILRSDDGSGGVTAYLTLDGSATRIKVDQNMEFQDSVALKFGTSDDMRILHDGSHSYIRQEGTGNLYIRNDTADNDIVLQTDDGSGGTTDYIRLDGSAGYTTSSKHIKMVDSAKLMVGTSEDAGIYHNGTDTYFENGTGNIYIRNLVDDGDLIFQGDDGSGGNATYLYLDGSAGYTVAPKTIKLDDDARLDLGSGNDLKMWHDGSHNYMQLNNGNLYFRDDGSNNIFTIYREGAGVQLNEGDVKIPATSKIYLDGGGDTYI